MRKKEIPPSPIRSTNGIIWENSTKTEKRNTQSGSSFPFFGKKIRKKQQSSTVTKRSPPYGRIMLSCTNNAIRTSNTRNAKKHTAYSRRGCLVFIAVFTPFAFSIPQDSAACNCFFSSFCTKKRVDKRGNDGYNK